jgi:pimeloyl-ACP methyl ester carboxylesterase
MRAARAIASTDVVPYFSDTALRDIMSCNDDEEFGTRYRATLKSANAIVRPPFRRPVNRDCEEWATRAHARAERKAARSDVPVLIITGYLDDRTPTELARRIAATLPRATLVEMRNEGHDPRPSGCHMSLMVQFFANPAQRLDTSCAAHIAPIQFATTWADVPNNGVP